jgi:hypothetical protein
MAAKATKKKPIKKSPYKKKVAGSSAQTLKITPKHTFEELEALFWMSFGQGAGLPVELDVIPTGTTRFTAILQTNLGNGTLDDDTKVADTTLCCRSAGEIATSIAKFKKHTAISSNDFNQAADLLEAIAGGGSGGLC